MVYLNKCSFEKIGSCLLNLGQIRAYRDQ